MPRVACRVCQRSHDLDDGDPRLPNDVWGCGTMTCPGTVPGGPGTNVPMPAAVDVDKLLGQLCRLLATEHAKVELPGRTIYNYLGVTFDGCAHLIFAGDVDPVEHSGHRMRFIEQHDRCLYTVKCTCGATLGAEAGHCRRPLGPLAFKAG